MLQKLIDELKAKKGWHDKTYYDGIDLAIRVIESKLPEFEDVIKKAYEQGYSDGWYDNGYDDAQDYYNKTYKK